MAAWREPATPRRRARRSVAFTFLCVLVAAAVVVFAPTPKPGPAVDPAAPPAASLSRGGASTPEPRRYGALELVLPIVGLCVVVGFAWSRLDRWLEEALRADLSSTEGIE